MYLLNKNKLFNALFHTLKTTPQMVVPVLRADGRLDPTLLASPSISAFLEKINEFNKKTKKNK